MIVNINDIVLTDELLDLHEKALYSGASKKNLRNNDKYYYIDWTGTDIKVKSLDNISVKAASILMDDYSIINDREFFGLVFKKVETKNEEYLWNYLVDCRLISDRVYQKNTYDENLDILFKNRK